MLPARAAEVSGFLAEFRGDELAQGLDHLGGLTAARLDEDGAAGAGGEHHKPHDRCSADGVALTRDVDLGVEAFRDLDEARGGARMQTALVDDREFAVNT